MNNSIEAIERKCKSSQKPVCYGTDSTTTDGEKTIHDEMDPLGPHVKQFAG
jgi:hypothetical protein